MQGSDSTLTSLHQLASDKSNLFLLGKIVVLTEFKYQYNNQLPWRAQTQVYKNVDERNPKGNG